MTTTSTKKPTETQTEATSKEDALGAVANSVISGLSPKDKALVAGLLVLLGVVTSWFNKDTQDDIASMKIQTAVMVEKLQGIQDTLNNAYTKEEARYAWERQKEKDDQQTKLLDKVSTLLDEHLRNPQS